MKEEARGKERGVEVLEEDGKKGRQGEGAGQG